MSSIVFPRVTLFGVPMARLSMLETLLAMEEAIDDEAQVCHTMVNARTIVNMVSDVVVRNAVLQADLITTDSRLLVWASRILGKSLPEPIDKVHLLKNIALLSREGHYRIFFFGLSAQGIDACVNNFAEKFSRSIIAGSHCGEYDLADEKAIAEQIADSEAQVLFLDLPSPQQENFLRKHGRTLSRINVIVKCGRGLELIAERNSYKTPWKRFTHGTSVGESLIKSVSYLNNAVTSTVKFLALILAEGFKPKQYSSSRRGRLT